MMIVGYNFIIKTNLFTNYMSLLNDRNMKVEAAAVLKYSDILIEIQHLWSVRPKWNSIHL